LDLRARVTARSRRAAPLDDDQLLLHAEHDPDVLAGGAAQDGGHLGAGDLADDAGGPVAVDVPSSMVILR
jgi:hypothetical protein